MSFLNPVNEPVLRFKSTDAGAPQVNYAARTAGDVKAILKACLVTGYGAKESAGWTAVNDVAHVIEFVSPSVAMSDYRLGIDDTSASNTNWYYQYQNVRADPNLNAVRKDIRVTTQNHASNGWQLLVTPRGICFIEALKHAAVDGMASRITYFGHSKAAVFESGGANMVFFNVGQDATITDPTYFYTQPISNKVNGTNAPHFTDATPYSLGLAQTVFDRSNIDIASSIYLLTADKATVIAELPGLLSQYTNSKSDMYVSKDITLNNRPAITLTCGYFDTNTTYAYSYARTMILNLDYWEY